MNFKDRLIQEKKELDEKIEKLASFIDDNEKFSGIGAKQQSLLHVQLPVMQAYSQVLLERIVDLDNFKSETVTG